MQAGLIVGMLSLQCQNYGIKSARQREGWRGEREGRGSEEKIKGSKEGEKGAMSM